MGFQYITLAREGDFSVVTMSRPERRNALSEPHLLELREAIREAGASATRGIIVAARGPVFCAGHDFADMQRRDFASMRALLELCSEVMQALQRAPKPVIAQVEGLATAAGCQLVASCDLAVAGQSARFQVPGGRGGWFCTTPGVALVRAIGRKRALEMLLTGDPIDAGTALEWGLVNRVVPAAEVAAATRELLTRATRGSARSKMLGKRAFYEQIELDQRAAYGLATEAMAGASQIADAQENLRAFLKKRRPRFDSPPDDGA